MTVVPFAVFMALLLSRQIQRVSISLRLGERKSLHWRLRAAVRKGPKRTRNRERTKTRKGKKGQRVTTDRAGGASFAPLKPLRVFVRRVPACGTFRVLPPSGLPASRFERARIKGYGDAAVNLHAGADMTTTRIIKPTRFLEIEVRGGPRAMGRQLG